MSSSSAIEWTDATWNPVRGCTKISPGCKHCYAETFAERWRGLAGHPYEQGFDLRLVPEKLAEPLTWASSKMVFVNSMSDLFQEPVPDEFIVAVGRVMEMAPWHTFQVLTKRSARMRDLLNGPLSFAASLPNIWWGVSVEDRKYGLPRVQHLREAKARVRFLSIEPLLESLGTFSLRGIHWVIVGGESGPGARPMSSEWVTAIRDDCDRSNVPFFFKQWGGVRKGEHGRRLERRLHNGFPQIAQMAAPRLSERRLLEQQVDQLVRSLGTIIPSNHLGGTRGATAFNRLGA
ncbi:MAG: phage Gp37/Gp68 family protein [Myxococcaceae bacterium]